MFRDILLKITTLTKPNLLVSGLRKAKRKMDRAERHDI